MESMEAAARPFPDRASIAEVALGWFVLLRSGQATGDDLRRCRAWLEACDAHRVEFEACSRLWDELDQVRPWLHEELEEAVSQGPPRLQSSGVRWYATLWPSAVMAVLLAVVVGGGWWLSTGYGVAEYRTAKGERRTVVLSDGSTMTLNTGTVVATEWSLLKRAVVLREGEALFTVSHGGLRPFEVVAEGRIIRDVGTRFVIRRDVRQVTVTVVEGTVEVQQSNDGAARPSWLPLLAGEQVSYDPQGFLTAVHRVSLPEATAWMDGTLVFENRPLAEVIQEVGRYHRGDIRVLDAALGQLTVSGVFGVHDREGFLRALEQALPIVVTRAQGDLIVVEPSSRFHPAR